MIRGQPCGYYVPVDGFVPPNAGVEKFRVAYRLAGTMAPLPGAPATKFIPTKWRLAVPNMSGGCTTNGSSLFLVTDANGWMDANTWFAAKAGTNNGCANSNLLMAVWDTTSYQGTGWGPSDPNGHYVLWLEWMIGGVAYREPVEHHLQLDNKSPSIPYPNGLKMYVNNPNNTQGDQVFTCGNETTGAAEFQIWGQFEDAYYSRFKLEVYGGGPPSGYALFGPHKWWDSNDGTVIPSPIKNTNSTGTTPPGTPVHLRNINLATALGATFTHCCYWLSLTVYDASILNQFDNVLASDAGHHSASRWMTFSAGPP